MWAKVETTTWGGNSINITSAIELNREVQEQLRGMEATVRNEFGVFVRWAAGNRELWKNFEVLIREALEWAGSVIQDRRTSIVATSGLKYGELLPSGIQTKLDEFLAFVWQLSSGTIPDSQAVHQQAESVGWIQKFRQMVSVIFSGK